METFEFVSAVRGYHIYKDIGEPSVGEKLIAHREFGNQFDKFAIKVLNDEQTVGHLPREYSRVAWYFLARGVSITLEVTGRRLHCKQLWGNGNSMLCKVLLFERSDHKPFKRPVNKEGVTARNVSLKQAYTHHQWLF